jgi:hypothetical protein
MHTHTHTHTHNAQISRRCLLLARSSFKCPSVYCAALGLFRDAQTRLPPSAETCRCRCCAHAARSTMPALSLASLQGPPAQPCRHHRGRRQAAFSSRALSLAATWPLVLVFILAAVTSLASAQSATTISMVMTNISAPFCSQFYGTDTPSYFCQRLDGSVIYVTVAPYLVLNDVAPSNDSYACSASAACSGSMTLAPQAGSMPFSLRITAPLRRALVINTQLPASRYYIYASLNMETASTNCPATTLSYTAATAGTTSVSIEGGTVGSIQLLTTPDATLSRRPYGSPGVSIGRDNSTGRCVLRAQFTLLVTNTFDATVITISMNVNVPSGLSAQQSYLVSGDRDDHAPVTHMRNGFSGIHKGRTSAFSSSPRPQHP